MLFARVGTHSVNPAMKATLPYTLNDFRFVTVYEISPVAKVNEGGVAYSSSGVGSLPHLASAMVLKDFSDENPLEVATHIPQKGGRVDTTIYVFDDPDNRHPVVAWRL